MILLLFLGLLPLSFGQSCDSACGSFGRNPNDRKLWTRPCSQCLLSQCRRRDSRLETQCTVRMSCIGPYTACARAAKVTRLPNAWLEEACQEWQNCLCRGNPSDPFCRLQPLLPQSDPGLRRSEARRDNSNPCSAACGSYGREAGDRRVWEAPCTQCERALCLASPVSRECGAQKRCEVAWSFCRYAVLTSGISFKGWEEPRCKAWIRCMCQANRALPSCSLL